MSERTEVTVESLRVSLTNQYRIILLKEKNGVLSLPLFIGQFEAEAIVLSLQDIEISRPQAHDLILSSIKSLGGRITSVEITEMRAATYYAEILIEDASGAEIHIDCRPSDALAAALRAHAPIYVDTLTMEKYGIQPETDIRISRQTPPQEPNQDDDSLSAFKDFLDNF